MGDWLQDRCNSIQKAQQEHVQKAFEPDIEKARSGIYKPTKTNLKAGKAGQKYGIDKKEQSKEIDPKKKYDFRIDGYVDSYQHMEPISMKGTIAEVRQKAKEKFDIFKTANPKDDYWMTISVKDKDSRWGFKELFDERVKK